MKISKALQYALDYHKANPREKTVRPCEFGVLSRFEQEFEGKELDAVTSDDVLAFLSRYTEGTKRPRKRFIRYLVGVFHVDTNYAAGLDLDNPHGLRNLYGRFRSF